MDAEAALREAWWLYQVGERTPWYPSVRLFRRTPDETWRLLFRRIAAALRAEFRLADGPPRRSRHVALDRLDVPRCCAAAATGRAGTHRRGPAATTGSAPRRRRRIGPGAATCSRCEPARRCAWTISRRSRWSEGA